MQESKRHLESLRNLETWLGVPLKDHALAGADRKTFEAIDFAPSQDSLGAPIHEASLDQQFQYFAKRLGKVPHAFWPEARPYALCITHDMDRLLSTIQRAKRLKGRPWEAVKALGKDLATALSSSRWSENSYFPFPAISQLQSELGFRSALYVLFEKRRWMMALKKREWQHAIGVYRPSQIQTELQEFYRQGNEIGIHGSFDSFHDLISLRQEKAELENFGISKVYGIRNHYLNFREATTPQIQKLAGFVYDSTQGFNFRAGFRTGTAFPYRRDGIWELPFQLMDSALRFQFETFSQRNTCVEKVHDTVRRSGGVLVVNWHTHTLNAKYFSEEVELLSQIIQRAKSDGAWIARPIDVIRHWEKRAEMVASSVTARYCENPEQQVL